MTGWHQHLFHIAGVYYCWLASLSQNISQSAAGGFIRRGRRRLVGSDEGGRRRRMLSAPDLSDITFQPVDRSLAGCEDKMWYLQGAARAPPAVRNIPHIPTPASGTARHYQWCDWPGLLVWPSLSLATPSYFSSPLLPSHTTGASPAFLPSLSLSLNLISWRLR